jgi:ubiquinone/menaquinone biosynthesis C-methylase UbiE
VTRERYRSAAAFSDTATDYARTMAVALAPVAATVVARAALAPGETVIDLGTGTGTAARLAAGEGRRVIGLDAADGMLEIARAESDGIEFLHGDFTRIPLEDATVDVVLAVHALLFAEDRAAALAEWRRITAPGGRMSLSVPGPDAVVPAAVFGEVYDRYGISWTDHDYPVADDLVGWARSAGWTDLIADSDDTTAITLSGDDAFRTWLRVGRTVTDWPPDRVHAFGTDLMAVAPRDAAGTYRIPFGTLYLTARNDG